MHDSLVVLADESNYINVNECFEWRGLRPSWDCHRPGFFVELVDLLRNRLNVSAVFINGDKPETLPPEINLNDEDLIFGALRNKSVDLLAAFFDNTDAYGEDFEVTRPIYFSHTKFIVGHSKSSLTGMFAFFSIYDFYIWIAVIICFVLVLSLGLLIYLLVSRSNMEEAEDFWHFAWQISRMQVIQYDKIKQKLISSNSLTLIFGLLQCGIVIRMYNNLITTQAVRQVDPHPFKEHEITNVLREKKYSLIFQSKLRWWYQDIMNENLTGSPFYELREAIKDNPIVLAEEQKGVNDDILNYYVMDRVHEGPWITIDSNEGIELTRQLGYCNMIYMEVSALFNLF